MNVSQAIVAALMAVGQTFVVEAQGMQNRGVQIVQVDWI